MQFTAAQIAQIINGKVEGNAETAVSSFGKIEEATKGQLSFLANPKYEEYLYKTGASIIIVNNSLVLKQSVTNTLIRVEDAYSAFATLLDIYQKHQSTQLEGIEQPLFQHPTAKLGEHIYLGAFTYIGQQVTIGNHSKVFPGVYLGDHVSIGENTILHAGVKIYHHCTIGSNVIIHAGTVIGSDGFGFAPQTDGTLRKIPQTGNVVIEDDVEIGANCTIDRATIGSTLIKKGAKLDNLLQIAHNVEVGNHTVIAAQTGVSGSTKIGKNVMIGGQAGIAGHIQIADGTKVNGKSGVTKTIKKTNTAVTGNPAYDFNAAMKSQAALKNLPALEKRVKQLEDIINNINK